MTDSDRYLLGPGFTWVCDRQGGHLGHVCHRQSRELVEDAKCLQGPVVRPFFPPLTSPRFTEAVLDPL